MFLEALEKKQMFVEEKVSVGMDAAVRFLCWRGWNQEARAEALTQSQVAPQNQEGLEGPGL